MPQASLHQIPFKIRLDSYPLYRDRDTLGFAIWLVSKDLVANLSDVWRNARLIMPRHDDVSGKFVELTGMTWQRPVGRNFNTFHPDLYYETSRLNIPQRKHELDDVCL